MTCEHCGRPFGFNRFDEDAVYCEDCADELGLERDGSEKEKDEQDDE